ncbi:MAG: PSD1 and planctomycete cytochrome C domain-containing protein [Verrucomicrobiales bacterium]
MKKSTPTFRVALLALVPIFFGGCGVKKDSGSMGEVVTAPPAPPPPVSFNKDIRPILSENCFFCHGPDPRHRGEDLRLDLFEAATEKRDGIAAIVPGDREKSEAWRRMLDSDDPMPPVKSHKALKPEQIELLGRWIDEGATYEPHWAYVKPEEEPMPGVSNPEWKENPIDSFILAKLDKLGFKPSPPADRRTLLRRVTFDLTGLPPTPEQTAAFLADESPGAYERYVDSLLADTAYGEHLAVWWLDLVRYGDTTGQHSDNPISVWPYRDWVIRSLNENLPFDQFTVMQLAGDLMQPEPTKDMLVASAYNRLALHTEEGGAQPREYEVIYRADRVANYSDVWLASTVSCAQCHDHKFDPITTRDFYTMAAFFADIDQAIVSTERNFAGLKSPIHFLPENEQQAAEVAKVEAEYKAMHEKHPDAYLVEEYFGSRDPLPPLPGDKMPEYGEEFKKILDQRTELARAKNIPYVLISRQRGEPRTVRVLPRGNWQDQSGEVAAPAVPDFLGGPKSTEEKRLTRLDLAKWTVSEENPLTARAIVNRLWGRYFGKPISANAIELGSQGVPPSHPELLDWLAVEFREKNWDLKHMIRLIVTSRAYRQSADHRADLAEIDPFNENLFARQSALRLPAEAVRDQALAVSGLLDRRIGGKSVFPYQPDGHWEPLNFPPRKYPTSTGPDLYRRGLYTWIQRTFPHPMMVTFDGPSRETCTGQRMVSTTPLQALATLNGPEYVEAARVLAARLVREEPTDSARFEKLFMLVLARAPADNELATLGRLLENQRVRYKASPLEAEKLAGAGEAPMATDLDAIEVASWTAVCRAMLNLHETLTRN